MRAILLLTMLTACGEAVPTPGATGGDAARELNEAAEMLDANSVSSAAIANQGSDE